MRLGIVLMIVFVGMVTQSCRIEMPSLIELNGNYQPYPYVYGKPWKGPYDFGKSKALAAQGGVKDTLVVGDDEPNYDFVLFKRHHGREMVRAMNVMGIPETHMVFIPEFSFTGSKISKTGNEGLEMLVSEEYESLRKATRVVHLPLHIPLTHRRDALNVKENNMLFVVSSGNLNRFFRGDRDLYSINHPIWGGDLSGYTNIRKVHDTGKAVRATSAKVTESGEVEPHEEVVKCGDLKESCFTIIPEQYTSPASARLSAISFYLAQFWETPEEIVEVLKSCAVDVGEPGVDREYGQGVANLLCPQVLKKEVEVVSQHLEDAGEKREVLQGGYLPGTWGAENTTLEVYIPKVLQEVLQAEVKGEVTGAVEFKGNRMVADISIEAMVQVLFLQQDPIEAKAEDTLRFEEAYTVDQENLVVGERSFHYTATEDSLFLVKSFSLNEILSLLPDPLGSMVDMASPDFFVDDPIQLRMSFSKEKPSLPGDFNEDGRVDVVDYLIFLEGFGSRRGEISFDETLDLVPDGIINIADFLFFVDQFGKTSDD